MKKSNLLARLAASLAFLIGPTADAAETPMQQTATITGRVSNVATGMYLNNARVSIKGTDRVAFTDASGTYQLVSVPSGLIAIEVFYTDLDPQTFPLNVAAGERVERDVGLTSKSRYGENQDVTKLHPFLVSADKETDSQAIATNEQRFSPNIKSVMATDSLGDVLGSSVGEFLKFMPGVTAEFDNADIVSISIRGIGGGMTGFMVDGASTSSVGNGASREVDLRSMALNDISRMEVTKVPTPSSPADSIGGTVNMIRKSAFERSKTGFQYGVTVVGNSENITLKKTPHSYKDRTNIKVRPGFNFDYTWILNKNFGVVVTGMSNNVFNEQHIAQTIWQASGAGTGASFDKPFLQRLLISDGPRNLTRNTLGINADWRVTPHSVLSAGFRLNRAETEIGNNQLTFDAGTNGNPNPVSGVGISYGSDFTAGATGRGSLAMDGINQRIDRAADTQTLNYRFDDGTWKLLTGLSRSVSTTKRRYDDVGIFFGLTA
jgi:iron complex outermembrane recepter protein